MVFDIDGNTGQCKQRDLDDALARTLYPIIGAHQYKIYKAGYQKPDGKLSYHIVINVACDLQTNVQLARTANSNFKSITHSKFAPFDVQIYALNKSLRLPLCGKVVSHENGRKVIDMSRVLKI